MSERKTQTKNKTETVHLFRKNSKDKEGYKSLYTYQTPSEDGIKV